MLPSNVDGNLGIKSHRKSAAYPDGFVQTVPLIGEAINKDFIVFFDLRGFPQLSSRLNNLCVCVCGGVRCMAAPSLKVLPKERRPLRAVTSPSVHQPKARTLQKR